jgi:hypothetical protein
MLTRIKSAISKFHNDEAGLEALQVVMILAIAALCLVILKAYWNTIKDWFKGNMDEATKEWAK